MPRKAANGVSLSISTEDVPSSKTTTKRQGSPVAREASSVGSRERCIPVVRLCSSSNTVLSVTGKSFQGRHT